ncbi:hypothetical protein [Defluviimonas salinarum]|uniref:Uncharacterized protein n=1 Tax=Defluviimonas salinarum TaxID=2992147 RepID=A0ABT3J785_9RHOB|nr:hypothetical protein [Defluviimonas salinarum]MCW3783560.1 hypothetical protein [Defluviimonas salinarum]
MSAAPSLITAFQFVLDLARQGILEVDDAGTEAEAVDQVEDLLTNNHEAIEGFLEVKGGADVLRVDGGGFPEIDLDGIRGTTDDPANDAMAITFELACRQFRDGGYEQDTQVTIEGETAQAGELLDMAGAFWERFGREIGENIIDITLPEGFFDERAEPGL